MNDITELVFILDRSGSMAGLEKDTIGGFNSMIEKQRAVEGCCLVTTVLFDHESETVHDRVPLDRIRPMTQDDYYVRGSTALLDALGDTIRHIVHIHRYARPEDVPAHTTFIIMTDGMENASRRYDSDEVKTMIDHEKEKYGWEFLFLAANIDAVETAARMGIRRDRAVNYHADRKGTAVAYDAVAETVSHIRLNRAVDPCWSKKIRDDYESRNKE